jgi:heme/copper-type cytochrome/quinol oxidase subunit 2
MHEHVEGILQPAAEPIFWIAAAICVVAELLILRAAFAPPGDAGASAPVPQSPRGIEMIWAVIPAVMLGLLLAATWRAIH